MAVFLEVLRPAASELKDYLSELGLVLPEGFRAEINIDALNGWKR